MVSERRDHRGGSAAPSLTTRTSVAHALAGSCRHRIGFGVDRRRFRAPGGGAAVSADRVLLDERGPHGRRRIRVLTVLSTVGDRCGHCRCGATVRRERSVDRGEVEALTLPFVQKFLWDGLQNTLQITAVSGVLALPLGVVFALLRLSRRPAIRWNATSYIEIAIQVYIVISLVSFVINLPGDVDRPFLAALCCAEHQTEPLSRATSPPPGRPVPGTAGCSAAGRTPSRSGRTGPGRRSPAHPPDIR